MKGLEMGADLVNDDMGMQPHIEVIQFRGEGIVQDHWGWTVFVNSSEIGVVLTSHLVDLFVRHPVICDPRKVMFISFKRRKLIPFIILTAK